MSSVSFRTSRLVNLAFAALIALALLLPLSGNVTPASAAGAYTTDSLNLRAGPSTSNHIKLTMPEGAWVELLSDLGRSGFYKVSYNGELGYAYGDYLSVGGDAGQDPGWGNSGTAYTTSALNLRSGPSTSNAIHLVMPSGAAVQLTGAADSGFYGVVYAGQNGWAHGDYLSDSGGGTDPDDGNTGVAYVDSSLNLRSGPGTDYAILDVMPGGAEVTLTGEEENDFAGVRYNGTSGWAHTAYLSFEPGDDGGGNDGVYTYDEIVQIIYAAADRYGQSRSAMLAVAQCESLLDPNIVNQSSGASGLFQFMPGTWATTPYAAENIFDPVANANAAGWMWSVGRRGEWVC